MPIATQVLVALCNLCNGCPETQDAVGRHGSCCIIDLLDAFKDSGSDSISCSGSGSSVDLLEAGCATVNNLTHCDANKARLGQVGACQVLLRIMDVYSGSSSSSSSDNRTRSVVCRTLELCCRSLFSLCSNPVNKSLLLDLRADLAVQKVLERFPSHSDLVNEARDVLLKLDLGPACACGGRATTAVSVRGREACLVC